MLDNSVNQLRFPIVTLLRCIGILCLIVMFTFPTSVLPRVRAQSTTQRDSYWNAIDLVSGWSVYPVTFDGKISSEEEWSDAYQQNVVLYRGWFTNEPHLRAEDVVTTTFYVKNDAEWLFLLAHVNSTSKEPEDIGTSQFWWSWQGFWDGGREAGVRRDGSLFDAYYVNDTYFNGVAPSNVRGASSCVELVSGSDCWFEFAKRLRSDAPRDWTLFPGETVGTSDDHRANVYVDFAGSEQYVRFVTLHLSPELESEGPGLVETVFDWTPASNATFGYGSFAKSPDFVAKTGEGTYEITKVIIEATVHKPSLPERDYAFDLWVTAGGSPEIFSLKCNTESCVPTSTNPYYGIALLFDSKAHGDQRIEVTIDFSRLEFAVVSSNSTHSPTRILHSDRLSFDSMISTTGSEYLNVILWSGHRERAGVNLQMMNATMRIQLSAQPRLLCMLPKPTFEEVWTSDISRGGDIETPIASVALTDDGRTLMAANVFNDRTGLYEGAEIYLLNSQGGLLWSKKHRGGMFFWNLLNLGLTPDGTKAAYAIFSSYNKSDAGIYYVDADGNPIWTYHDQWYHSVSMSADGMLVAAVKAVSKPTKKLQADGNLLVLNGQGQVLWQHRFPEELPMRVVVSADGRLIAVATGVNVGLPEGLNSAVYLFDASGRILWRHVGESIARAVDLSTQVGRVAVSYRDGTIELLDLASGAILSRYFHSYVLYDEKTGYYNGGDTFSVAITDDGGQIVTSQGFDLFVFANDLSSLFSVPWMPDSVSNIAESGSGDYVAAGTFDGKLHFYRFSLERTDEYVRDLDSLRRELGLQNVRPSVGDIAQLEAQGKWLGAYQLSKQMVNGTIAAMRSHFSESYTNAQTNMSEARKMFNVTSARLKDNSGLDVTQASNESAVLSEASGLLDEAESFLVKASQESNSGNYPTALRSAQAATLSIEDAMSQLDSLHDLTSRPMTSAGINWRFLLAAVVVAVLIGSLGVWAMQKRKIFCTI